MRNGTFRDAKRPVLQTKGLPNASQGRPKHSLISISPAPGVLIPRCRNVKLSERRAAIATPGGGGRLLFAPEMLAKCKYFVTLQSASLLATSPPAPPARRATTNHPRMEQLLHYVWRHRLFPPGGLNTTDGREVEVIDPGLPNGGAGPDFFNAKVRIGGTVWVGNVEIHSRASDWRTHGHDRDAAYDNVVLHVVGLADCQVADSRGRTVAQAQLGVPEGVARGYAELTAADSRPPCHAAVGSLPRLAVSSWLAALATERLEQKTAAMARRAEAGAGSWEEAYFATLARNFGFGVNGEAFEQWAAALPLAAAAHHRDDLFQVEALFLGQAGLLDDAAMGPRRSEAARADGHFARMQAEYRYLAHKFRLRPMDGKLWKFLRLRPQNFPYIRISQLARLYHEGRTGLSRLLACADAADIERLYATSATPYWQEHYAFGEPSRRSAKRLSAQSLRLLAINTAIPTLFAYGRHSMDESLCRRAADLLESLPPEDNAIVRTWGGCGIRPANASESQALVQLTRQYCDRRDCLRCRFGYEYLRKVKR